MIREGQPRVENPYFSRELSRHEKILIAGACKLAEAIKEIEPDEEYPGTFPQAVLIGGFVRDSLLGLHPKDADLEVYGVKPEILKEVLIQLFGEVNTVGEAFGILKVPLGEGLDLDVSIPRRESKSGNGHQGFKVQGDPSLTLIEAARRRDFSVNAMAMDPLTGTIFDPFGGLEDIKNRHLRVTDPERFKDDALRILRGVQFAARLNFSIEPESLRLMQDMVSEGALENDAITPERVSEEWKKLFLKAEKPSVGLEAMRSLGLLERYYPELNALIGCEQEAEWYPEGDAWTHTKLVVDAAAKIMRREGAEWSETEKLVLMLGAVCHDLGKPLTTEFVDGRIRSRGHEEAGQEPTKAFFDHHTFSDELRKRGTGHSFNHEIVDGVLSVVTEHLKPGVFARSLEDGEIDEKQYANIIRKLIKKIQPLNWRVFLAACEADRRGSVAPGTELSEHKSGLLMAAMVEKYKLDQDPTKPLVQGRDVLGLFPGRPPGKWVGEIVKKIETERDAGNIQTREEALGFLERLVKE